MHLIYIKLTNIYMNIEYHKYYKLSSPARSPYAPARAYANDLQKFITISRSCLTGDVFLMSNTSFASPFFPTGQKPRAKLFYPRAVIRSRETFDVRVSFKTDSIYRARILPRDPLRD